MPSNLIRPLALLSLAMPGARSYASSTPKRASYLPQGQETTVAIMGAVKPPFTALAHLSTQMAPVSFTSRNGDTIVEVADASGHKTMRLIKDDGKEVLTGSFKENEAGAYVLDGFGRREYPRANIVEEGVFSMGHPQFVVTYFHDHKYLEIGSRLNTYLDGPLCIWVHEDGTQEIGVFKEGQLIDGYKNGHRYVKGNLTPFNPYDQVPVLSDEDFKQLRPQSVEIEGLRYRAILLNGVPVYGTSEDNMGGRYTGFLTGSTRVGRRQWPGGDELGIFAESGAFLNGRVTYMDGNIEIGPRQQTFLEGDNVTKYEADIDTLFQGSFLDGGLYTGTETHPTYTLTHVKGNLVKVEPKIDAATFNPYAIPDDYIGRQITSLPYNTLSDEYQRHFQGYFLGAHMVYGTKCESGFCSTGFFDSNGFLQGIGKRTFDDGGIQHGLYINHEVYGGNYTSSPHATSPYTVIGKLRGDTLYGKNGTLLHNKFTFSGEFDTSGHLIRGTVALPNGVVFKHGVRHQLLQSESGDFHYLVDGEELKRGQLLAPLHCASIFEYERTPLLFDPKKARQFMAYLSNQKAIGTEAFYSILNTCDKDVSQGQQVARHVFRYAEHTDMSAIKISERIKPNQNLAFDASRYSQVLSPEEQRVLFLYISHQLIKEFGEEACLAVCLENLQKYSRLSEQIGTGMRSMSRTERSISFEMGPFEAPLLVTFFNEVTKRLSPYLPDIQFIPITLLNTKEGYLEIYTTIYTVDKVAHDKTVKALLANYVSAEEILQKDIAPITGFEHGIPLSAVNRFSGDYPKHEVYGDIFYRVPEELLPSMAEWDDYAYQSYKAASIDSKYYEN